MTLLKEASDKAHAQGFLGTDESMLGRTFRSSCAELWKVRMTM